MRKRIEIMRKRYMREQMYNQLSMAKAPHSILNGAKNSVLKSKKEMQSAGIDEKEYKSFSDTFFEYYESIQSSHYYENKCLTHMLFVQDCTKKQHDEYPTKRCHIDEQPNFCNNFCSHFKKASKEEIDKFNTNIDLKTGEKISWE